MRKLIRYSGVALESIKVNKLRSTLTMLGLIIGVASVLTTIGIGRGAAEGVTKTIEQQGVNTLSIYPEPELPTDPNTLTWGDVEALTDARIHPEIVAVAPTNMSLIRITKGDKVLQSQVTGTTAEYATVRNVNLPLGDFFTKAQELNQERVVVLSASAAQELFGMLNPVGQTIRIKSETFRVIGVKSQDIAENPKFKPVYVPLNVAQHYLFDTPKYRGEFTLSEIVLQVKERSLISSVKKSVEQTLRLRHKIAGSKNDFTISDMENLISQVNQVSNMMTALLGSIGTVSLLVGGIGIMNIMLVSVTERTKEIGLRKALGARDQDILLQFLIEAILLCTVGSIVGVALSYSVSFLLNQMNSLSDANFPFSVIIEFTTVLLGLGVGLSSGFIFGLYPAIRATKLDPIEALRYE